MATITSVQAKTRFGELLERVERGEEIVITRHEKPVARLVPEGTRSLQQVRSSIAAVHALRQEIADRVGGRQNLSDSEVRSAIEEGRL